MDPTLELSRAEQIKQLHACCKQIRAKINKRLCDFKHIVLDPNTIEDVSAIDGDTDTSILYQTEFYIESHDRHPDLILITFHILRQEKHGKDSPKLNSNGWRKQAVNIVAKMDLDFNISKNTLTLGTLEVNLFPSVHPGVDMLPLQSFEGQKYATLLTHICFFIAAERKSIVQVDALSEKTAWILYKYYRYKCKPVQGEKVWELPNKKQKIKTNIRNGGMTIFEPESHDKVIVEQFINTWFADKESSKMSSYQSFALPFTQLDNLRQRIRVL